MVSVVNNSQAKKPVNIEAGMLFKTNRDGHIYILVDVNGGRYLVNLSNGYEWDGCDISEFTLRELEENEEMTLLQVKNIVLE